MTTPYTVPVKIGNLAGGPLVPANPVVDSVADHSVFPASLLERLGIEPLELMTFRRADGSRGKYDIGIARIVIDARERPCPVVFGPEDAGRLGVSTLAIFNLEDDPAGRRLLPASNLSLGLTESDGDAAKEATPLRLTAVAPRADSRIWLRFSDGAAGEVDLSPLVGTGVFRAWADPSFFQSARLEDGAVIWGDELALCSDALYLQLTGKSVGDIMPGLAMRNENV